MAENLVSLSFSGEEKSEIDGDIRKLYDMLMARLINLTPEEKVEMLKLGDRSLPFVHKARDWAVKNPNLIPPYGDLEGLKMDLDAVHTLGQFLKPLKTLVNALEDTIMQAGSEAYKEALTFYGYYQSAAEAGVEGAQEAYGDMKERFPGRRSKPEPEESED